jgi:hypothetical protein
MTNEHKSPIRNQSFMTSDQKSPFRKRCFMTTEQKSTIRKTFMTSERCRPGSRQGEIGVGRQQRAVSVRGRSMGTSWWSLIPKYHLCRGSAVCIFLLASHTLRGICHIVVASFGHGGVEALRSPTKGMGQECRVWWVGVVFEFWGEVDKHCWVLILTQWGTR